MHDGLYPLIGVPLPRQTHFQVIVRQGLGPVAAPVFEGGVQRDCLKFAADEAAHEGELALGPEFAKNAIALARDMHRDLVGHARGGGAWARGESKYVQIGEWQIFDQGASLFEFGVGFTREPDHYVRADCRIWHGGANLLDLLAVMPGAVFPVHAAKNWVAAGLHGK